MSWNFKIPVGHYYGGGHHTTAETFDDDAAEALAAWQSTQTSSIEDPTSAVMDQVDALRAAAKSVIESGAVGEGAGYMVLLAGHANPDHLPKAGWSDDMVTLTITQVAAAPPAVAEVEAPEVEAPTPDPDPPADPPVDPPLPPAADPLADPEPF